MSFTLPKLSYSYDALEPVIDTKTMEIHHLKHHAGYTNNLNSTLDGYKELQAKSIENILKNLDDIPEEIKTSVINNGGGFFNHSLYWEIMTPGGSKKPLGNLETIIDKSFGGFNNLKELFNKEAIGKFGSGWTWLTVSTNGGLKILSTSNQDCPISQGLTPILGIDIWEHAYYLNYQNRRAEYVQSWWDIINWEIVSNKYNNI